MVSRMKRRSSMAPAGMGRERECGRRTRCGRRSSMALRIRRPSLRVKLLCLAKQRAELPCPQVLYTDFDGRLGKDSLGVRRDFGSGRFGVDAARTDESPFGPTAGGHSFSREKYDVLFSAGNVDFAECGAECSVVFDWADAEVVPAAISIWHLAFGQEKFLSTPSLLVKGDSAVPLGLVSCSTCFPALKRRAKLVCPPGHERRTVSSHC